MSIGTLSELNWLAIVVATLAYFAVGAVWYLPATFGKPWMRSMGWEPSQPERGGYAVYAAPLVTCLLTTIGISMLAKRTGSEDFAEGLVLGLVVGLLIVGSVIAVIAAFDPKKPQPAVWAAITAGYHVVGILAASTIVAVWQ